MQVKSRETLLLCLVLVLAGCRSTAPGASCPDMDLTVHKTPPDMDFMQHLEAAPRSNRRREAYAYDQFKQAGCPELSRQPVRHSRFHNIVCTVPGESAERIIIGAHHDKLGGRGAADNWTGVLVTTRLLADFTGRSPQHTLQFVAFGEEEAGMAGARSFLRDNRAPAVLAYINVDTLGLTTLKADFRSDGALACLAGRLAQALGIRLETSRWDRITGDWVPFRDQGLPVIAFHSIDRRNARLLHSWRDHHGIVSADLVENAYVLIRNLLENLDRLKVRN